MSTLLKPLLVLVMMVASAALAVGMRPTGSLADERERIDLPTMVPTAVGDWREAPGVAVQIIDPEMQQTIDAIYTQVLTRNYVHPDGYRVMVSIAYGKAQTDNLQLHLPEVCYPAQGFKLEGVQKVPLDLGDHTITARRLVTHLGQRFEPLTYWTVVGDHVTASGIDKKLTEMRYGLRGRIPDGMLVRISSIDRDSARAHQRQAEFAAALVRSIRADLRGRFAGLRPEGAGRTEPHHRDPTDSSNLIRIVGKVRPDEIYNLGAMSHVAVSFETPEYTADADAMGTLRLLEAIRMHGLEKTCRFYQASTSELYGKVQETPQRESTPFYPRSPYAVAKLFSYWITVNYREAYGMYACNGILFNHESPVRGETFVTRKITRGLARIALGLQKCLYLGNLSALRDWGHAKDYVEMQWRMLQQDQPEDFVIATGIQHSVRQFVEMAAGELGIELTWVGSGVDEAGVVKSTRRSDLRVSEGDVIVRVDARYFRPTEVDTLLGDPTRAKEKLGWAPTVALPALVREMVLTDYQMARRDAMVKLAGFPAYEFQE